MSNAHARTHGREEAEHSPRLREVRVQPEEPPVLRGAYFRPAKVDPRPPDRDSEPGGGGPGGAQIPAHQQLGSSDLATCSPESGPRSRPRQLSEEKLLAKAWSSTRIRFRVEADGRRLTDAPQNGGKQADGGAKEATSAVSGVSQAHLVRSPESC